MPLSGSGTTQLKCGLNALWTNVTNSDFGALVKIFLSVNCGMSAAKPPEHCNNIALTIHTVQSQTILGEYLCTDVFMYVFVCLRLVT